jgi:predicted component of type VI protein secretion system
MTAESLHELLARVQQRLTASGSLDGESRQLLGSVMRDIERALGASAHSAGSPDGAAAHAPRLETLAVRFEAGHPGLAEVLRELVDALGKAGI